MDTSSDKHRNEMCWKRFRKEKLSRETDSLLIAVQIKAIRTNYIKVKIDNSQKCGYASECYTHKIESNQENEMNKILCDTELQTNHPIQKIRLSINKKKRWRCPWCNGYCRRTWTRRHEFKSWTWLIAFHIALIPLGKVWIQLFSLQLWVNSRAD